MPLVSVVIPVFNVERYLRACLDSVIGQSLRDVEVICVNDGSTDRSGEILSDYVMRDARIRAITQTNSGLSQARNRGFSVSTGRYVHFLDGDDVLEANSLERLVSVAERDELDVLVFAARTFVDAEDGDGDLPERTQGTYQVSPTVSNRVVGGSKLLIEMLAAGCYRPSVPLKFFRRSFLEKTGLSFPVGLLHEDVYYTSLALALARRAEAIPDALYGRRVRARSITTAMDEASRVRRLAHAMLIDVRLGRAAKGLHLRRECRQAIGQARRSLRRFLVKGICRNKTSVRSARRMAWRLGRPAERPALWLLSARLTCAVFKSRRGSHKNG